MKFRLPFALVLTFLLSTGGWELWRLSPSSFFRPALPAESRRVASTKSSPFVSEPLSPDAPVQPAAQPSPAPVASGESVPENLGSVFPGLPSVPADWRQYRPADIIVSPCADIQIKFNRKSVKDEDRYVTWIGRSSEIPGASLVAVATVKSYDAVLIVPGTSQFAIHVDTGGRTTVSEAAPGEEGCGVFPVQSNRPNLVTSSAPLFKAAYTSVPGALPQPVDELVAAPDALKVDVLFLYDADTLAAAATKSSDPAGYIDGLSKAYIESGNVVLAQSGVTNFVWRYLGALPAPNFPCPNGKVVDRLNAMLPGGVIGDWTKNLRYAYGADQIVFWIGGTNIDFAGQAFSNKQTAIDRDSSLAALAWGSSYKSTIHEMAHNFGCEHDRANAGAGGTGLDAHDGDGYWCYGQLWNTTKSITDSSGTYALTFSASTIMGYGSSIIPYYSNPNISANVTSMLAGYTGTNIDVDWGVVELGMPMNDQRAAYNAKVLTDNAGAMSALSDEITTPLIITQPANTSAQTGGSFSMSVTASGGGLYYQWTKDGNALNGATASL
ncbi:MAG: hypothetical protein ACHQ5A_06820, partial [Opitutales bacterium]